jgi:hypothetical protein
MVPLKFLSEARLLQLRKDVGSNLPRYSSGDFVDLERDNGWAIESPLVKVNLDLLGELNARGRTAEEDVQSSQIVYRALEGMTPALASEERVWVRLTHIECLNYSRQRWLVGRVDTDLVKSIGLHMFAAGRTGIRDDNALSRLWWNMHIAQIADPSDPLGALQHIAKRADIRMQFVERPTTAARVPLARAVVRAMRSDDWLTSSDEAFRAFMKVLNRNGGGVLFESLSGAAADSFVAQCREQARGM